ncbi:MFS transporter [Mesobacillus zeae]|uniref:MFS transporter n=1 Tax=Mesobacillus zeae TaxID=1917180 RepID=A0A398B995_9BACI|nr:MFS transporter [Mesobacillus zeae]RID84276.1 MFS transporter [Mesobacillus zeae]
MSSNPQLTAKQKPKQYRLLKNREFIFLVAARCLTSLAFGIYMFGESWYIVNELHLKQYLGITLMAASIPRLILMYFGGILSDQYSRTQIMSVSLAVRALLVFSLAGLLLAGSVSISVLLVCAILYGISDSFFYPANSALVPEIVEREDLTRANSILQSINLITLVASPFLGGLILGAASYSGLFFTTGLFLIIGGASFIFIRTVSSPVITAGKPSISKQFAEGYRFVRKNPILLHFMAIVFLVNLFIVGPVNIAIPLIVEEKLQGNPLYYSFLQSALFFGLMIATIFISVKNVRRQRGKIILAAMIFSGLSVAGLSYITNVTQGMVVLFIYGVCLSVSTIIIAMIQEHTPNELMGKVMGLTSTASLGLTPLSYGLTSLALFFDIQISVILLVCGSIVAVICSFIMVKIPKVRYAD